MRSYYNPHHALGDYLLEQIKKRGKRGINRAKVIQLAREQGFIASDARLALHNLAFIQQIEFTSDATEIRVREMTGEAKDKPAGVK